MRMISPSTSAKLFATGATVGPIVDSLHNQCLLRYDVAPISLEWPAALASFSDYDYFFCSSWYVPPLLGVAYSVLGGVLPRLFEALLPESSLPPIQNIRPVPSTTTNSNLRTRAIAAVATTALIIKLSEYLETNPAVTDNLMIPLERPEAHILVMLFAALSQWALLDGTIVALLVATITSIGGPLSELPFVASDVWVYLEQAGDYLPLANVNSGLLESLLGENYQTLALSSITGPCYFAVTMDAIALGRWFDADESPTKSS
jgi:hypothetical protein